MSFKICFFVIIIGIIITPSSVMSFAEIQKEKEIFMEHYTRPTFGLGHENLNSVVKNGFKFNGEPFNINNNFHTPFERQVAKIGEINTFEATIFAEKGLRVQEFLFGIPEVGKAHLAELGVEVWLGFDGKIKDIKVIQQSNVIDEQTILATNEKTKCRPHEIEENCHLVSISAVFLEPLKHRVMAIKGIDFENRYNITYLNEGIDVEGISLNPMKTKMIPSSIRDEGVVEVTQTQKYSKYWMSKDGRIFEQNDFGSFRQINKVFERFQDSGNVFNRLHSDFGKIIEYEQNRAVKIFNSTTIQSELPDSFSHYITISERITGKVIQEMKNQESIAQQIRLEYEKQARW